MKNILVDEAGSNLAVLLMMLSGAWQLLISPSMNNPSPTPVCELPSDLPTTPTGRTASCRLVLQNSLNVPSSLVPGGPITSAFWHQWLWKISFFQSTFIFLYGQITFLEVCSAWNSTLQHSGCQEKELTWSLLYIENISSKEGRCFRTILHWQNQLAHISL